MARNEVWVGIGVASLLGLAFVGVFFAGIGAAKRQQAQEPPSSSQTVHTPAHTPEPPRNMTWAEAHDATVKELLASDSKPSLAANLSGSGVGQSDSFTVKTNDQFVSWALDPEASVRSLIVRVKGEDRSNVDQFIPDVKDHAMGNARLRLPPGTYYLDVTAFGEWKIAIFEAP